MSRSHLVALDIMATIQGYFCCVKDSVVLLYKGFLLLTMRSIIRPFLLEQVHSLPSYKHEPSKSPILPHGSRPCHRISYWPPRGCLTLEHAQFTVSHSPTLGYHQLTLSRLRSVEDRASGISLCPSSRSHHPLPSSTALIETENCSGLKWCHDRPVHEQSDSRSFSGLELRNVEEKGECAFLHCGLRTISDETRMLQPDRLNHWRLSLYA